MIGLIQLKNNLYIQPLQCIVKMDASVHLVTSLVLAALLYPLFGWLAVLVLVSGFMIDIDHYFWYVYKTKDFSFKGCYGFYMNIVHKMDYGELKNSFLVFHTIEPVIAIIFLSFFSKIFLIILSGLLLHFALDTFFRLTKFKMLLLTPPSIIGYLLQPRKSRT